MNARTHLSAKGQVVIPKGVRERLDWTPGTRLEVVETAEGVTLRRAADHKPLDHEAALARLRATIRHHGPKGDEAQWKAAVDSMLAKR